MATPQRRASDVDSQIAGLIDNFNNQITQIKTTFDSHALQIERRMDQIIEMGKSLAVVQQKQETHDDVADELRTQLRDAIVDSKTSIERIHKRIDDEKDARVKQAETNERECDLKLDAVAKTALDTEKKLDGWLMWGKGIWGALTISVLAIGWLVNVISTEIKAERDKTSITLESLKTSEGKLEVLLDKATTTLNIQVETNRKLEQRVTDTERQTDMIMQQLRGKR